MMLSGVSSGPVCGRRAFPIHAFQTVEFLGYACFNKTKRLADQPCRHLIKQPIHITQLLPARGNLKQQTAVLALPKEDDEADRVTSHACMENDMLVPSGKGDSFEDLSAHIAASVSHPENYSENSELVLIEGSILDKLKAVHLHILASERWNTSRLKLCNRNCLASATNLIHYLALKSLDIKQLKEDLSSIGLGNLDTINPHVLPSLTSGIQMLQNLNSKSLASTTEIGAKQKNLKYAVHLMKKKASYNEELIFGTLQDGSNIHIMATVGQEATETETLINDLLNAGTTIVRINCAHGNPSLWSEIIRRVKRSSQMLEKPCRILMDLAGPKLRTGRLKPGPCVIKISPKRSATGNVTYPAQVWVSHKEAGPLPDHLSPDVVIFIDDSELLSKLELGDVLRFRDARGKKRTLKVSRKYHVFSGTGLMAECSKTAYVQSGTDLYIKRKRGKILVGQVVDVPALDPFVRLKVGDLLVISRDSSSSWEEQTGLTSGPQRVTCSSGLLFDSVKLGEVIAFDDGKIWGVIKGTSISEIIVSITHAGPKGTKLGSDKSINIPESTIQFKGLTSKDLVDLEFVAAHADMVGISFIRDIQDIVVLSQVLEKRKFRNLGIVLKIETKSGFEKLPHLLLEAMRSPNPLAVMIARGDLAVECGWKSLADIQEEILSVCRAAHVPVIWATQVLESLVKSGVPTRAELTDVASGRRANCIMLNKGKHIVEAVSTLDTILRSSFAEMKAELKPLLLSSQ